MEDFKRWYEQEHPRVLSVCAALTGELSDAGEATDEAFARALERWPVVSSMTSPGGWVQVVALNRLRRTLRRRSHEQRLLRMSPGGGGHAGTAIPDPDLWAAVASLAPRQRAAVLLRYVHDLPEAAIAEAMGVSRGTVASTLAAARGNLQRMLRPAEEDAPTSALPDEEPIR